MDKMKILFLCTGNSCRSQMAEGLARHFRGDKAEFFSAGINPHGVDPRAVRAMKEAGIDTSSHRSKHVNDLEDVQFDYVVTVCGDANENCPFFPGKTTVVHVGFEDPPRLAQEAESEEEAMSHYRRVRDQIREFVMTLPESLDDRAEEIKLNP